MRGPPSSFELSAACEWERAGSPNGNDGLKKFIQYKRYIEYREYNKRIEESESFDGWLYCVSNGDGEYKCAATTKNGNRKDIEKYLMKRYNNYFHKVHIHYMVPSYDIKESESVMLYNLRKYRVVRRKFFKTDDMYNIIKVMDYAGYTWYEDHLP